MCNLYFNIEKTDDNVLVKERQNRSSLINNWSLLPVTRGDILVVVFRNKSIIYRFEGICLAIRNKSLLGLDTNVLLRNVLLGTGVEFTISYYFNRIFALRVSDYKRKQFNYKASKLYFLRNKVNRASRVL